MTDISPRILLLWSLYLQVIRTSFLAPPPPETWIRPCFVTQGMLQGLTKTKLNSFKQLSFNTVMEMSQSSHRDDKKHTT